MIFVLRLEGSLPKKDHRVRDFEKTKRYHSVEITKIYIYAFLIKSRERNSFVD